MSKRLDTPDTLDGVLRFVVGLQADGWGVKDTSYEVEYVAVSPKHRKVPAGATVTIRLTPAK